MLFFVFSFFFLFDICCFLSICLVPYRFSSYSFILSHFLFLWFLVLHLLFWIIFHLFLSRFMRWLLFVFSWMLSCTFLMRFSFSNFFFLCFFVFCFCLSSVFLPFLHLFLWLLFICLFPVAWIAHFKCRPHLRLK